MPYVPVTGVQRGFARIMAAHGETMTLARDGEGTTITLKGKRILAREKEEQLGNASQQQFFRVKVGTTELAASAWASKVPARNDSITIGGRVRQVIDVRPVNDAGQAAYYDLDVSG